MMNGRNGMRGEGLSFFTGCLLGGIAGLLYAPQSGARTRRRLASLARDVREKAGEMADDATVTIKKAVERGRRLVNT